MILSSLLLLTPMAATPPVVAVQGDFFAIKARRVELGGGEVMEREIHRILESLGSGPFIFNLGHGIIKETSPDNVAQLVEVVRGG